MKNELRRTALERFKRNWQAAVLVAFLCGLLLAASILTDLLLGGLAFLIFCFVIIPILFACHITFASMLIGKDITIGSFFSHFRNYYSFNFFGCYRICNSILKTILMSFVTCLVFGGISFLICSKINYAGLLDSIEYFTEWAYDFETTVELNEVLAMNNNILWLYMLILSVPSTIISMIYFAYKISFNSFGIYMSMSLANPNRNFVNLIYKEFLKSNKRKVKKDYFALNWPMYVLMLVFAALGVYIGLFFTTELEVLTTFGVFAGAIGAMLFLPFYFFNMQALYEKYDQDCKKCTLVVSRMLYERIKQNAAMAEAEKKRFEDLLNNNIDNNDINNDQEKAEDEKKENDPFGS